MDYNGNDGYMVVEDELIVVKFCHRGNVANVTTSGDSKLTFIDRHEFTYDALKKSFKETCRPILGADGCFLKHACGGQLLCVVGRDGNNHMFPVAWAVVEKERTSSWEWFFKLVSEDLGMDDGKGWTIVSDQQKGLVEAIHRLWPEIEHRQCARHIFSNWRKKHRGKVLEYQFWRCVKATSEGELDTQLLKLKNLSEVAYLDFVKRNPDTFCKSRFKTHASCDVVDNNMAETFNSFILLARYKPIISMLEDIRLALMERMRAKKSFDSHFIVGVAPRISQKLEEAYEQQRRCDVKWNGEDSQTGFEVHHDGIGHAVDISKRTCSCRGWDLTGVPCCHGMAALLFMKHQPENFLANWYSLDTYKKTYSYCLKPVPGATFWCHDGEGMVLPPDLIKGSSGKRKTARRRDADEPPKNRVKFIRNGISTKCSNCGLTGHDKRKCQNPPKAAKETQPTNTTEGSSSNRWKGGRPKGSKNRIGQSLEDLVAGNVARPTEYVQNMRRKRGTSSTNGLESIPLGSGETWVEEVTARRKTKQMKGKGRGRMPDGIGVIINEAGETMYRTSRTGPVVTI